MDTKKITITAEELAVLVANAPTEEEVEQTQDQHNDQ